MSDLYPLPPTGDQYIPQPPPEAPLPTYEIIREGGMRHEYSIRSLGVLYYLGGAIWVLGAAGMGWEYLQSLSGPAPGDLMETIIGIPVCLGFAAITFAVGYGLRRVYPWVRIPVVIMSLPGILSIPIGTLICGYVIWMMVGKEGSHIFSAQYQEAIRMTPYMKYKPKSNAVAIGCLVFVLLLIVGLIIYYLVSGL